ncbi:MAG: hypothetical protein F6K42_27645 [Leptolyngbya sp. SIO1D8]|nr:hypothetical protein [Leptolyngbya sp. SIO1D8]
MRVLALTSCGSIFMLTSYMAFRHDAVAGKANNNLPRSTYGTDQTAKLTPEVNHLQLVSQPEVRESSPFIDAATTAQLRTANASSPWAQTQRLQIGSSSIPRPSQRVQFSDRRNLTVDSAVYITRAESPSAWPRSPYATEVSPAAVSSSSQGGQVSPETPLVAASATSVAAEPASPAENSIPETLQNAEPISRETTDANAAAITSVNLSVDAVVPVATVPSADLPQTPQFSGGDLGANYGQPEVSSEADGTEFHSSSGKPVVQKSSALSLDSSFL